VIAAAAVKAHDCDPHIIVGTSDLGPRPGAPAYSGSGDSGGFKKGTAGDLVFHKREPLVDEPPVGSI
jgi:hypothetical protein